METASLSALHRATEGTVLAGHLSHHDTHQQSLIRHSKLLVFPGLAPGWGQGELELKGEHPHADGAGAGNKRSSGRGWFDQGHGTKQGKWEIGRA